MKVKYASATVTGLITAPCEKLFAIVSDPTRHPELAGSGEVREMKVYEPPYRFIWLSGPGFKKPLFGQLWGFDLKPLDARSTIVSHLMKVPFPLPPIPPFTWIADAGARRAVDNMRLTFENLARMANAHLIGELKVKLEWCENNSPTESPAAFRALSV